MPIKKLTKDDLRACCNMEQLRFETTKDVPQLQGIIGQPRAERAMQFGLLMERAGYNIFVSGIPGLGKNSYVREMVKEVAAKKSVPRDWCYVYNFDKPDEPIALDFPPGGGTEFATWVRELVDSLQEQIMQAFEGEEYAKRKAALLEDFTKESQQLFVDLESFAQERGFVLKRSNAGLSAIPVVDGQPVDSEEMLKLDDDLKRRLESRHKELQEHMSETIRKMRCLEKEAKKQVDRLEKTVVEDISLQPFLDLKEKYADIAPVQEYLNRMQEEMIENLDELKDDEHGGLPIPWLRRMGREAGLAKYEVNLFIDNSNRSGAPVVFEPNPNYYNLQGKLEYRSEMGMFVTDFRMLKPGAMHRANGGYLVLQAQDLLSNYVAWDAIKRVLRSGSVMIEGINEQLGLTPMASLKPQPIPIDVKVILIGNPALYYLLENYDEDFGKLFKVKVDFDTETNRDNDNVEKYVSLIATICHKDNLKDFTKDAVAEVIEYSSRLAAHKRKLSTQFNQVLETIYEADAWAAADRSEHVERKHVQRAIAERRYRASLYEEKIQELINDGSILIDTEGKEVGQVNGLAVIDLGDYMFGKPSRITAETFVGEEGVINIEREARLDGRIHNKGVLILSGYLAGQYAREYPLSLSATLCFEQSYDGVDGDSASSAELYALLSSLAGVPVNQSLAVTGSINQKGEVQPVGAINEKIEGFFAVCKARGLTGDQGVVIPHRNMDNLMLCQEVVGAVEEGLFHIYAVEHVNEGIELVTGVPAGKRRTDGTYEKGTINYLVEKKLAQMAKNLSAFKEDVDG
ncbi:MAG: AAA family ATPase [Limnochordia bacterium]|nr:AAA family ATPase [Limnochordia bacterium]